MKHAGIIPLIGGEILASEEAYGVKPEYLLTYSGFMNNEKHLIHRYKSQGYDIPYHILDQTELSSLSLPQIDIMSSVCPCAGLSNYHNAYGEENQNNQWLEKTTSSKDAYKKSQGTDQWQRQQPHKQDYKRESHQEWNTPTWETQWSERCDSTAKTADSWSKRSKHEAKETANDQQWKTKSV
jgi:hypothetical protein